MVNSGIHHVVLNEKKTDTTKLKKIISALCNQKVLDEKGGYIFKALIQEDVLYLGILPCFIDGKRTYHFDIKIPQNKFTLIGFINSNGSIGLLFKITPEQHAGISSEDIKCYRKSCIVLARFLLEFEFHENFKLDDVTSQALTEINIFAEAPLDIKELAFRSF